MAEHSSFTEIQNLSRDRSVNLILSVRSDCSSQCIASANIIHINTHQRERENTMFIFIYDSAVGIATGYGMDNRGVGVRVPVRSRIFSSPLRPDRLWGPPSFLSNGYRGQKRQGREADHSPPASAEVKKTWLYTSTPPYVFMA
jgi:hypothetical protein